VMAAHAASRRLVAEALGTGVLLAVIVGSGIMAERLSGGNMAIALARQHAGHGRWPLCAHRAARPGQRRPLQSGRVAGDGHPGQHAVGMGRTLRRRATVGRHARRLVGPRDVRCQHPAVLDQDPQRHGANGLPRLWPRRACC
jgi:hypothetical protein